MCGNKSESGASVNFLRGSNKQSRIFRLNDVIMAGNCEYKFELYKHSTVVNKDSQIF